MFIEITYSYTENKEKQISWKYFKSKYDDLEKAKKEASKHFSTYIRGLNWTSKVKVLSIDKLKNENSPPIIKRITTSNDASTTPAIKRSTRTPKRKPKSTSTSDVSEASVQERKVQKRNHRKGTKPSSSPRSSSSRVAKQPRSRKVRVQTLEE